MNINIERRAKPRVNCNYPAVVELHAADGKKQSDNAKLANLSASGLYMKTNRFIENGLKLSVTVLLTDALINENTPKLTTRGVVVRSESQLDGSYGIAVKFSSYRFQ